MDGTIGPVLQQKLSCRREDFLAQVPLSYSSDSTLLLKLSQTAASQVVVTVIMISKKNRNVIEDHYCRYGNERLWISILK